MNLLDAALDYLRLGISVIPIGSHGNGKQPAIREWKPYQTTLPKEIELREWFSRSGLAGLAIIFGPVSGGIYCRDFDNEAAYRVWSAKNPTLAATLPTVRTFRGYHVYFRNKQSLKTKKYADGEIRCFGAYCLAPPSKHPEGIIYEWLTPITTDNLITIEQPYTVFSDKGTVTESTESTEGIEKTESIETIENCAEKAVNESFSLSALRFVRRCYRCVINTLEHRQYAAKTFFQVVVIHLPLPLQQHLLQEVSHEDR
jgi:hypothetical protein